MCTVAFLPIPDGGYLIGHNRDESRRRARGLPPSRGRRRGRAFLAPRDPDGGGTWLGVNEAGLTLSVLNAAEPDPSRLPAVPPSRGRVAWDLLHLESAGAIAAHLERTKAELLGVRAFHLVVAVPETGGRAGDRERPGRLPTGGSVPKRIPGRRRASAVRFRWDGRHLRRETFYGPALFVYSGYDQAGAERERGRLWRAYLSEPGARDPDRLAAWLAGHEPSPGELSVCMHRGRAHTVSRTIVCAGGSRIRLIYHDGRPCDASAPEFTRTLRIRD
jgi:hypothetical protein